MLDYYNVDDAQAMQIVKAVKSSWEMELNL
jgi:hypothetical protein